MSFTNVTVLGTGMMGPGIALLFAQNDFSVTMWGPTLKDESRGSDNYQRIVQDMERLAIFDEPTAQKCRRNVVVTSEWSVATAAADIVIEAVPEILELKQKIFLRLEQSCPAHTIFASNTSTLLPSAIAAEMTDKSRALVAHFWNPAHLVPLVEVCGHLGTHPEVIAQVMELLQSIGCEPVHIRKEILGFIGNRIMHAMNREALALVSAGVCSPEDIDRVVLSSFGPRFANLGLLEYLDFVGLEHVQRIQNYLYADLDATPGELPIITQKVAQGELGCKTGKGLFDWSKRDPNGPGVRRDAEFIRRRQEKR